MFKLNEIFSKCLVTMLVISMVFCLTVMATFADATTDNNSIKVLINGVKLEFDTNPVLISDRTFVPMRKIFETLRANVIWEESTQTVTAVKGETTIVLQINNAVAKINGKSVQLDAAPCVINDRTLVPIRFIAQSLGAQVGWNGETSVVSIDLKDQATNDTDNSNIKKITTIGVIDSAVPDKNVYEARSGAWPDSLGTTSINGNQLDKRIFYKLDLSSLSDKNITSAKLVMNVRGMKYGAMLFVYEVTSDWDMKTISYNNAPKVDETEPIVRKLCEGFESSATIKELDITDYVKTLSSGNGIVNIMLKATSKEKENPFLIDGVNSKKPPYIEVVVQ